MSRNKKTGKAKHYAFLEFQYPEVAATAAEAMNDYMLFTQKLVVKMVSEKVYWLHHVDLSALFKHPMPDIPSSPRHQSLVSVTLTRICQLLCIYSFHHGMSTDRSVDETGDLFTSDSTT